MEKLIIESTVNSPKIVLDPDKKTFEFSGESRPENVRKFFMPVLEWLEAYAKEFSDGGNKGDVDVLHCRFEFEYFNSTSAKYILDIFKLLSTLHENGPELKIEWIYEEDDEDMLEVGQEMSRMSKLPFEYVVS